MGDAWYMQTFCYLTAPLACVMVCVGVYWGREMMWINKEKTPHLFSDEEHFLEMKVDFLQPFLDIKARTALANPGEVAMA